MWTLGGTADMENGGPLPCPPGTRRVWLRGCGERLSEYVSLSVRDNGPGIEADIVNKVFEPFFPTRPIGEGIGLDLSMPYGFARQSGGTARIDSVVGEGATIELLLPRGHALQAVAVADTRIVHGGAESILLVDDDEMVRTMALEALVEAGYEVVGCADGKAALAASAGRSFDLLRTDVGLPDISGCELAERMLERMPGIRALFITGYAENAQNRQSFRGERMGMLPKPFNLNELLREVRQNLVSNRGG